MKKLILVFIGGLSIVNSFASDEVTVKVEGCSVSMYHEIIGLLEKEDLKQNLGMFSEKCHRGILSERRIGSTVIKENHGHDYVQDCSLEATRTYFCLQLPW